MSGTACHLCGRTSGDDATVCTGCAATCTDALRQVHGDGRVHGLDVDLDVALARQDTFGSGGGRRTRTSGAPLPMAPHASEAAAVLRSTLVGWVRVVREDTGALWPNDSLAGMARWLAGYIGWMRHAPHGAECIDEITAAVDQARRAVDRPVRRVPLHVPCRTPVLDGDTPTRCGGTLVATLAPGLPAHGQVRCTSGDPEHATTVAAMIDRRRRPRVKLAAT